MTPNRYAPPGAEVADPVPPRKPVPRGIRNACWLVLLALALGIVTFLPDIRVPPPDEQAVPVAFTLVLICFFGGLTVWFAVGILRGRNWARWAMLAYLAAGWLLVGPELEAEFLRAPLAATIDAICIVMEAVACWQLFLGADAQWFSRRTATSQE